MAGIDCPQTRCAIKDLPPVIAGIMHILGGFQLARMRLERPVRSEGHPECGKWIVFECHHGAPGLRLAAYATTIEIA
jgi:hypothetical protein